MKLTAEDEQGTFCLLHWWHIYVPLKKYPINATFEQGALSDHHHIHTALFLA